MSNEELFGSPLARWALQRGGSIPIDRADPSPSSIKIAVDILVFRLLLGKTNRTLLSASVARTSGGVTFFGRPPSSASPSRPLSPRRSTAAARGAPGAF